MFFKKIYKYFLLSISKKRFNKKNVLFHENSRIDSQCFFEGHNAIGVNSILKNTYLGRGSYVGRNNDFIGVKIGNFCSIGSFIINTTGRHPIDMFVSTHPAFFSKGKAAGFTFVEENKFEELKHVDNNKKYFVEIGNDVWIGDRVTILDGIKIGDGAVIGSNALVTRDVDPYTINVGVPSKPIRKRFTESEIEFLLQYKWWEKDQQWLKDNSYLLDNITNFYNRNKNG